MTVVFLEPDADHLADRIEYGKSASHGVWPSTTTRVRRWTSPAVKNRPLATASCTANGQRSVVPMTASGLVRWFL